MKRTLLLAFTLLLPAFCLAEGDSDEDYTLVWADEFETDGKPDPSNWTYEQGFVRNNEFQWYQPDNAFCQDGRLIIEARRERVPNPGFQKGSEEWGEQPFAEYSSASLLTQGLHSWQYGRFEIKAKIQAKDGLWPAIWFMGVDGEWPSCGEIDLMEYYKHQVLANACWGTRKRWKPEWDSVKTPVSSLGDEDWDEAFHIWRMDWSPDTIQLYLDDQLLNTIDLTETVNPNKRGPKNPFYQPHYMLISLAIGGDCGGDPEDTPFPQRLEIDYVRVYQKRTNQE